MYKKIAVLAGLLILGLSTWISGEPVPGGTLDVSGVPKYVSPLAIPPTMPAKHGGIDYYEIAVRQFNQQILPNGYPETTVWSYGPAWESTGDNLGLHATQGGHYFYPAFTIEARHRKPVRVKWINELKHADGTFRPHLLPVDPTLHWANPPGGEMHRDMRPHMLETTPGPYTGPVPIVTHLHGAVNVGDESDGFAEAWFLPSATNIPPDYAKVGTWYDFFKAKAQLKFWQFWDPGTAVFQYPNDQRASTLWYHDHTLGMTRLNVYAGPAGFYLIRGGPEDVNLGYNPPGETLGRGKNPFLPITEIPIAIQDRSFNSDGSLFYPDSRAFFDGYTGPFIPETMVPPIWNPEFFGNTIVVNGQTWPFLDVEQRRYRLRLLNGCNSRFLILRFGDESGSAVPGLQVWQIGNEGGFLPQPLNIDDFPAPYQGSILLGLAERADIIVDFSNVPKGTKVRMLNAGPDEPFRGGIPGETFTVADPDTTGQVMEFRVGMRSFPDTTRSPSSLKLPKIKPIKGGTAVPLALLEEMTMTGDPIPVAALLGTLEGGIPDARMWMDPITENPDVGETQVWEFFNLTADAHPIHLHAIHFRVVDRQAVDVSPGGVEPIAGTARLPDIWEQGSFKDTVIAYPGEVTRIRGRFEKPGLFVWHCHIVEHEDNEMMRPYFIGGKFTKFLYDVYIKSLGREIF